MVLFEEWLITFAATLGLDTTSAGVIMSLIMVVGFTLIIAVATGGRGGPATLIVPVCLLSLFTFLGWLPYFVMLLVLLIVAGMYANQIKEWLGG